MSSVLVVGNFLDCTGYSQVSRNLIFAFYKLFNSDFKIQILNCSSDYDKVSLEGDMLDFFSNSTSNIIQPHYDLIIYITIPDFIPHIKKNITLKAGKEILITAFEGNCIPYYWKEIVDSVDAIGVPSLANKKAFEKRTNKSVFIIPHGLSKEYLDLEFDRKVKSSAEKFIFMINFDWRSSYRKGIDLLLHSYLRTFAPWERVALLIKTNKFAEDRSFPGGGIGKLVGEIMAYYRMKLSPEIMLVTDSVSVKDLIGLYKQGDCYISPSRSEGLNLCLLESMATGSCPIVTGERVGWDGQDFANAENAFLIKIGTYISGKFLNQFYEDSLWANCSQDHLSMIMRRCFERREDVLEKGRLAFETAKRFTWEDAAMKLHGMIRNTLVEKEVVLP